MVIIQKNKKKMYLRKYKAFIRKRRKFCIKLKTFKINNKKKKGKMININKYRKIYNKIKIYKMMVM